MMKSKIVTIFSVAALAFACLTHTPSHAQENDASHTPGLEVMGHPEYLPVFSPAGTQTLQFSSHDISGGNRDGDFYNAFMKYKDPKGEYVIFDAYGPGTLYRQQFNVWSAFWDREFTMKPGAGDSRIKFYFDDEDTPRIDQAIDEYFGGKIPPFDAPYTFQGNWKDTMLDFPLPTPADGKMFALQYYPLNFKGRLKITFEPSSEYLKNVQKDTSSWYQFTYVLHPPETELASWSQNLLADSRVRTMLTNVGQDPKSIPAKQLSKTSHVINAGQSEKILNHNGQAAIAQLRLKMSSWSVDHFYNVWIKMTWDDRPAAVEMPIGVFFGGGGKSFKTHKEVPNKTLNTLFYGYDGTSSEFYSYWPMPFWRNAKIEIVNKSNSTVSIKSAIALTTPETLTYVPDDAGYFHAKQTKDRDAGDGLAAKIFREQGLGHVVGRTLYSEDFAMDGDEFTYIDGSPTPQIHGDGIEDDHNQGWGGSAYKQPLWGGVVNGYQGAYRLHMNDRYVFEDNIKIDYEYSKLFRSSQNRTEAIIYYYKAGMTPRALKLTDTLDIGLQHSEQQHQYEIVGETWAGALRSGFDSYEKDVDPHQYLQEGRAYNGSSRFSVAIHPANNGVKLRRQLSRFKNGVQTAIVYVDGQKIDRPWHIVQNSSAPENQAWITSDFELPSRLTSGKSKIRIEVHYENGTKNEINEFKYWVFSHVPPRTF